MGRIFSFSQNQLKVLLRGCGYDRVAGLNLDSVSLENPVVLNTLNDLTKKEIISSEQDNFVVNEEIKEIVRSLGAATEYLAVHSNDASLPDKCMFLSDKVLVCSSRQSDTSHIQAEFLMYDEVFDSLNDEGYFFSDNSDVEVEESVLEEFEQDLFSEMDPNKPLCESSAVLFSIEEITSDGQLVRYMRIVAYYFYTYIVFGDSEQIVREKYTCSNARKHIEKMINI